MATVKLVSDSDANEKVSGIFDDIKQTKGIDFIPNFWRALATNPDHLELVWNQLKQVMRPGKLDTLTKEMIALAVSVTNGCDYWINSHSAAVQRLGLDDESLGELMSVVALFNSTNRIADGYQIESDVKPRKM